MGMQQTEFRRSIVIRRARICHHKNEIFRKSTKRPAIINIQRKPVSHGVCSRPSFGILLLSEEHELALMASCGETGNDLAGDICRPCECVYQRVCNHKSRIFRRNIKRPAINQHGRESLFHMGMQQTDFPAFYCYQKSTNLPSWRVVEKLGMTLQETDTDPVNAFTSMYAITRVKFFAETQNALL